MAANSNLFSVDIDLVKRLVAEANENLFAEITNHLNAVAQLPATANTPQDIQLLARARDATKALAKRTSQSRLADNRPFDTASKEIKAWYVALEKPLKDLDKDLRDRISASVLKSNAQTETTVVSSFDGIPVAKSRASHDPLTEAGVTMQWDVTSYDIDSLDLNALKGFLTDYQIRMALKKHLDQHGPNSLPGVTYDRFPK